METRTVARWKRRARARLNRLHGHECPILSNRRLQGKDLEVDYPSLETTERLETNQASPAPEQLDALIAAQPTLLRNASRYVLGRQERKDLAQQASLHVLEKFAKYDGQAPLDRWILTVADRAMRNYRRNERLRTHASVDEEGVNDEGIVTNPVLDEAEQASAQDGLLQEQSGDRYEEMLSPLTPQEREIVEYIAIYGFGQAEVAKELGISQSSVSRIYGAAIERMRLYAMNK